MTGEALRHCYKQCSSLLQTLCRIKCPQIEQFFYDQSEIPKYGTTIDLNNKDDISLTMRYTTYFENQASLGLQFIKHNSSLGQMVAQGRKKKKVGEKIKFVQEGLKLLLVLLQLGVPSKFRGRLWVILSGAANNWVCHPTYYDDIQKEYQNEKSISIIEIEKVNKKRMCDVTFSCKNPYPEKTNNRIFEEVFRNTHFTKMRLICKLWNAFWWRTLGEIRKSDMPKLWILLPAFCCSFYRKKPRFG